jgi:Protein of unknown function (DUF3237)
MRLEPLYRIRFTYPESWVVGLDGGWQQMFFIAEGRCEGAVTGRFRGANFPRKEGTDGPFRPDFRAVIEADDGATIMVEWHGYGRAYPPERRQIAGALFHTADREPYRRLNDVVCVCVGEVRDASEPGHDAPEELKLRLPACLCSCSISTPIHGTSRTPHTAKGLASKRDR